MKNFIRDNIIVIFFFIIQTANVIWCFSDDRIGDIATIIAVVTEIIMFTILLYEYVTYNND